MGSLDTLPVSEYRRFISTKERTEAVQQLKRLMMKDGDILTRRASMRMVELREHFSLQKYWYLLKNITSNDTGESRLRMPQLVDLEKLLKELE